MIVHAHQDLQSQRQNKYSYGPSLFILQSSHLLFPYVVLRFSLWDWESSVAAHSLAYFDPSDFRIL